MDYQFQSAGPTLQIISLIFLFVFAIAAVAVLVGIAALPGMVAKRRQHPQAAAINIAGWFGLPTGIVWVLAMVWAYLKTPPDNHAATEDYAELARKISLLESTLAKMETGES